MTTREEKIFYLARVIVESMRRELEGEERERLDDWLRASDKNREMYTRFCQQEMLEEKIAERLALEWREDYEKFRKVYRRRQERRDIRLSVVRYAAVLTLLLSVGLLVWEGWLKREPVLSVVEANVLKEGKAVLTTAGGERIVLDDSLKMPLLECNGVLLNVEKGKVVYTLPTDSVVQPAQNVEVYNTLTVPRGGDYYLTLSDGTRVWLNAESEIRYPVKFTGKERVLYLEGEAYFEVTHDAERPFIVKTEHTSVRVLGTQFNLRDYPEEKKVETTLVSGSVVVHSEKLGQEIRLQPGEKGTVTVEDGGLSREKVNTYFYTAWKDGRLVFRDTRMEDLLGILARWYDLKIFYVNQEARDIRFTGDLDKSVDFNTILKIIEENDRVVFDVNTRVVSVRIK